MRSNAFKMKIGYTFNSYVFQNLLFLIINLVATLVEGRETNPTNTDNNVVECEFRDLVTLTLTLKDRKILGYLKEN